MTIRSAVDIQHRLGIETSFHRKRPEPPLVLVDPLGQRRCKIWDISPTFHCSIIGTCLTAADLRQFFVKLRHPDAKTATDHILHSRGVHTAGQHDLAGKLLHKAIDKRHETAIKRFAKADTREAVRDLWLQALDQGEISGAYWAVLTHPATDRSLIQDVFGEVHMLSHLVGMSSRLDIARLRRLESELGIAAEKASRQELRLQESASERSALLRRVESLEAELLKRAAVDSSRPDLAAEAPALLHRLDAEKTHAAITAARLNDLEARHRTVQKHAAALSARNDQLQAEIVALEMALRPDEPQPREIEPVRALDDRVLLYVGGRPKLVDQLKALTAKRGGALLAHDGGLEDNPALLPGLVSQADTIFFPVDCVSHAAMSQVKKLCRDTDKVVVPLRSASLASFVAALVTFPRETTAKTETPGVSPAPRFRDGCCATHHG